MTSKRPAPRLDIRLLGPPEVLVDGAPLVVDTRKAVAILAVLAAEGRAFARDELAALLWPDADGAAAHGALRRTLSALRAATGDTVLVDRARVALAPDGVQIDLADLERLAASDGRRSLAAAADLARGPFLAGFHLRDSPDFDDWRAARSAAVDRTVLSVLDRLAAANEAAGDLPGAIAAAFRRLDLDPLDEAGHLRLMDLYSRSGDRAAALRQYRACVAVLDRELGVAPLESTTARYEAIRDLEVPPVRTDLARPRSRVPPIGEGVVRGALIVGRDGVMRTLVATHQAAAAGAGRIAAITGEAGIGKTRLGEALIEHIRAQGGRVLTARAYVGERGIAYAPIQDLLRSAFAEGGSADGILAPGLRSELARLLPALDAGRRSERAPTDGPGAHARLVAAVADGLTALASGPVPGCVWVDDLQWADGATLEALDYLGRRLADRRMLVLLGWRPEDLEESTEPIIRRLATPPTVVVELERLDRASIAELAAPSITQPEVVDRLVQASEGLPLYVIEALAAGDAALTTMPMGVRAVLRARLASVGETAAQVLAAASVIGRSFDLAMVRYASGRSEGETVDALDESLRRGLIRETAAGLDFAHGGLRDIAYESISLTRRRLLHRRVAEGLRLDLSGTGRDDLARLAMIAAHERDGGRTAEAAEAFRHAGSRAAAIFANSQAIEHDEAALALGYPDAAAVHGEIGGLRTRLGDYEGAIAAFEAAAAGAHEGALPEIEHAIAGAQLRRGDLVAAARHLDAALGGTSEPTLLARVLVDRSIVLRLGGDLSGALAAARKALEVAVGAEDSTAIGAAHRSLGLIALASGDADYARIASRQAVAASDALDPTGRIAALTGLALAEAAAGDVEAGLRQGLSAVEICRRIGDRHLEGAVENHLADLLHAAGRDDDAMVHLRRAVEAFAEVGGDPAESDPGIWMLSAS